MTRGKTLSERKKCTFIISNLFIYLKKLSPKTLVKKLCPNVKIIQRYLDNLAPRKTRTDKGTLQIFDARDMRQIKPCLCQSPGKSSKYIFDKYELDGVSKTTRNCVLKKLSTCISPEKRLPLSLKHKEMQLQ